MTSIMKQLNVQCPVTQYCRLHSKELIPSVIDAANSLNMTVDELILRLKELDACGTIRVYWKHYSHYVRCGPEFPPTAPLLSFLVKEHYQKSRSRMNRSIEALTKMFTFLHNPSHALLGQLMEKSCSGGAAEHVPMWAPPPPLISKGRALEIAADFIREHSVRIRTSHQAAKALCGIASSSSGLGAGGPGGAGGMTLLGDSWYTQNSYYGMLERFEFEWVKKIVDAHN